MAEEQIENVRARVPPFWQSPCKAGHRIFILSDVRLFREGIAGICRDAGVFAIVETGSASNCTDIVGKLPDLLLVDVMLVKRNDLMGFLRARLTTTKMVAFAVSEQDAEPIACAEAGMSGYVSRDATAAELLEIVAAALREETLCPPRVASQLFEHIAAMTARRPTATEIDSLTPREFQILPMLGQGRSNKDIARGLSVETATVKNHVHNILGKLHLSRRAEVAALVARSDLRLAPETPSSKRPPTWD